MLRHRPVLLQPRLDVEAGNGLLAVFYHFDPHNTTCILSILYESEASYEARRETRINVCGSLLYRSHNLRTYHRTADIKHLAFHGVRLGGEEEEQEGGRGQAAARADDGGGWEALHTLDFSGVQSWSVGTKHTALRFLYFYSLMEHHDLLLPRHSWRRWEEGAGEHAQRADMLRWSAEDSELRRQQLPAEERLDSIRRSNSSTSSSPSDAQRPVVFVNTMNHLYAPYNANPHLPLVVHADYPAFPGERSVAEAFGQLAVAYKPTLFSCLPGWLSPLPSKLRAERRTWARLHHTNLLEGRLGGSLTGQGEVTHDGDEARQASGGRSPLHAH